jgi:SnoaL-like domain
VKGCENLDPSFTSGAGFFIPPWARVPSIGHSVDNYVNSATANSPCIPIHAKSIMPIARIDSRLEGTMSDSAALLAIEEIKTVKARYFRFIDTKNWNGLRQLFAEDAVLDVSDDLPGCVITGAEQFVDTVSNLLADAVSVHHGHCPEIELTSAVAARGIWPMEDSVWWPQSSLSPMKAFHGYGHYYETYQHSRAHWVIKTMQLRRLRVEKTDRAVRAVP